MEPHRTPRWRRLLSDPASGGRVAPVLPLTLLVIVINPLAGDSTLGSTITVLLVGGSALFALSRSGARRGTVHAGQAIVAVAALVSATSAVVDGYRSDDILRVVALSLFSLLLLLTPAVMILRLLARPRITLDTVAGALAAYLQVGIFFANLYRLVDTVGSQFFVQTSDPTPGQFQYFSLITLTTVGYGDFSAATPFGQLLASLEAVLGQLFLVTVVSLVVGNLGRTISRVGEEPATDQPAPGGDQATPR
jgi:voltage-gated potassium channel Kch